MCNLVVVSSRRVGSAVVAFVFGGNVDVAREGGSLVEGGVGSFVVLLSVYNPTVGGVERNWIRKVYVKFREFSDK